MLILPGHHSQESSEPPMKGQRSRTTTGRSACGSNVTAENAQPNVHSTAFLDCRVPDRTRVSPSTPVDNFDEYGAELGPEARVWKTYVREADRVDNEKMEEWNKSLDVILIFAALFSAISTAFVIESSKKLQEDPAEISAQRLDFIAQTLSAMINNTQSIGFSDTETLATTQFHPRRSSVWVNALWFLSLSLSVAVSLVSMLAKEWCRQFLSGRTGHPGLQAKQRQERWDSLKKWKMPEVIMSLPLLINLALLLFAIGLCIHLWELHLGAAIPVIFVTLVTTSVYATSTVLPFWHQLCPYATTFGRLLLETRGNLSLNSGSEASLAWKQDLTVSRALRWLIEKCEDPRSVDIALQSIAGADDTLPLEPLKKCKADAMVCQRLITGSAYRGHYDVVFELYARALAKFSPPKDNTNESKETYDNLNELRRKIQHLQMAMERAVGRRLTVEEFTPTRNNIAALRIGSTAALYCLQSLSFEDQKRIIEALDPAFHLLERRSSNPRLLHPAALQSLLIGIGMLLSCSLVHGDISVVAPYAVRLLRSSLNPVPIGTLFASLALARCDHPSWTHPAPLGPAARAERAIDMLTYYAQTLRNHMSSGLTRFGMLELLLHPEEYHLGGSDVEALRNRVHWISTRCYLLNSEPIHTFPPTFDLGQYVTQTINGRLSNHSKLHEIWANPSLTKTHLASLRLGLASRPSATAPSPQIYVFVLECIGRNISASMALDLVACFLFPQLSPELIYWIQDRTLIPILVDLLSAPCSDTRKFAKVQLHLFANMLLHGSLPQLGYWFQGEEHCNPRQRLELVKATLNKTLTQSTLEICSEETANNICSLDSYARRVLDYVPLVFPSELSASASSSPVYGKGSGPNISKTSVDSLV